MKKNYNYLRIIYLSIGMATIAWAYYNSNVTGSEAVLGSTILLSILSLPLSYLIGGVMFDIVNKYWPNSGMKFIPMSVLLLVGYGQWFFIIPKIFSYYKNKKNNL